MRQNVRNFCLVMLLALNGALLVYHHHRISAGEDVSTGSLRVAIIEDVNHRDALSAGQLDILTGTGPDSVKAYCDAHCEKIDGQPAFRKFDFNDDQSLDQPWVKDAYTRWQEKKPLPGMVIVKGRKAVASALQSDTAEALTVLRKYGGK